MDRSFAGDFTIAGRGTNRNFHGKIASTVVTTLKRNVAMPTDAEITKMITDPLAWRDDQVGETFRRPDASGTSGIFALNNINSARSTQIWLMGDGTNDSFSNMIRNQTHNTDQNETMLRLNNMQSNDIQTVNIPGLS